MARTLSRMPHINERIGAVLDQIREDHGLGERELSRLTGVPNTTLRAGLHGARAFRVPDLLAVCQVLGVSASTILDAAERAA